MGSIELNLHLMAIARCLSLHCNCCTIIKKTITQLRVEDQIEAVWRCYDKYGRVESSCNDDRYQCCSIMMWTLCIQMMSGLKQSREVSVHRQLRTMGYQGGHPSVFLGPQMPRRSPPFSRLVFHHQPGLMIISTVFLIDNLISLTFLGSESKMSLFSRQSKLDSGQRGSIEHKVLQKSTT